MRFDPGTSRRDAGPVFSLGRQTTETAVDILLAVLFPLTWFAPNLLYKGLFEILAACLSAEILAIFMLAVLCRRFRAESHAGLYRDWIFVRTLFLGYLGWMYTQGLPWSALLFMGVAVVGASFPVRVTSHPDWPARLQADTMLLVVMLGLVLISAEYLAWPPVPYLHLPEEGFVYDLVVKYRVDPAQVFVTGSVYYLAKALVTGHRVLQERRLRAATAGT